MDIELKEGLKTVLQFYRELGFESLPLSCSDELGVANYKLNDSRNENSKDQLVEFDGIAPQCPKDAQLKVLRKEIGECQRCKLFSGRTQIVFGEGSLNATIMFIGEAPGKEEDIQGRPFVGDAGRLLTKLIEKMGFRREDVYIANIVKCRPQMNREPQGDEMSTCFPFLDRQIQVISPKVIMSLGKIATYALLDIKVPMSKFMITKTRGSVYDYKGISVVPTFHPAYLLRNPRDKWLTWEDAQAVLKII
ncbi:uracil-DNA glycosylase [Thermodesulfovibrionales bacterium]|nr:uracil-DNA glycosylase [Thermodesulfovibrionales bacterium]MCL0085348.1 uracil-DNA glycosylase [Thermodesulfovibrionales bacterium]